MQEIRRRDCIYKANILTYQRNSVGIGEHPEIVEAIELQVAKLAEAEDKLARDQKTFFIRKRKIVLDTPLKFCII